MRSSVYDILPPAVRRSLAKFGDDIAVARRKRRLTAASMAERLGVSRATYGRIEQGDPSVGMGAYAQALFVLGFGMVFEGVIDQKNDERGLLLSAQQLPQRVRSLPRKPAKP